MTRVKRARNIVTHPLGVLPSGNAILESSDPAALRRSTLGHFGVLSDDLLMYLVQELPKEDLLNLGYTSKAFFAYCWFDELWKHAMFRSDPQERTWRGSWRRTLLGIDEDKEAIIDASGFVYSDFLHRPYELTQIDYLALIDPNAGGSSSQIAHYDESEVTVARFDAELFRSPFIARLEKPIADWKLDDLVTRFGDDVFRQEYMDWPLRIYAQYVQKNVDETPLYLFDCRSRAHKELAFETPLPDVFGAQRDFFSLFGEDRPDHQWLIVGPGRSGSTFHKDPNGTSAWNSVISGKKYWIMFPSNLPPPGVWTDADQSEVTAPVSLAEWFASGLYIAATKSEGFCHGFTGPGEVMYVPSGWWHAVVNLETSVAITGNFVARPHLRHVCKFLREKPEQISGFKKVTNLYDRFMALVREHDSEAYEEVRIKTKASWQDIKQGAQGFQFCFQ